MEKIICPKGIFEDSSSFVIARNLSVILKQNYLRLHICNNDLCTCSIAPPKTAQENLHFYGAWISFFFFFFFWWY
jgi:hypothetical protein